MRPNDCMNCEVEMHKERNKQEIGRINRLCSKNETDSRVDPLFHQKRLFVEINASPNCILLVSSKNDIKWCAMCEEDWTQKIRGKPNAQKTDRCQIQPFCYSNNSSICNKHWSSYSTSKSFTFVPTTGPRNRLIYPFDENRTNVN